MVIGFLRLLCSSYLIYSNQANGTISASVTDTLISYSSVAIGWLCLTVATTHSSMEFLV